MSFEIHVETADDARGVLQVQAFSLGSRRIAVRQVIDRWPGADHVYIKLIGDDDGLYILRRDAVTARWEMTLFQDSQVP